MDVKIQKLQGYASPFAGISFINALFNSSGMSELIDNELGMRTKTIGYSYSEIIRNLTNVFLSGGEYIEDINNYLKEHLENIPGNNVPSPDTVLRGINELKTENTIFKSKSGKEYQFNINLKLAKLLVRALKQTKQLTAGEYYDLDYDNQFIPNDKFDAKHSYKKAKGYFPGVATIDNKIVYLENRDGNANVKFEQASTLERMFELFLEEGIKINRARMDAGSYSQEVIDVVSQYTKLFYIRANKSDALLEQVRDITDWKTVEINYIEYEVASMPFTQFFAERNYRLVVMRRKSDDNQLDLFTQDNYIYRFILTNDQESTEKEVIEYYNQRGKSEKIFDEMNNDFGWKHLPFSFLDQNGAFMLIMAMIKNFFNFVLQKISRVFKDIKTNSRLKRLIFSFVTVCGKWVYQGRRWILKIHSNRPYELLKV